MTMHDAPMALLSALAGLGLGAFFFGGLWWTVRRVMTSPQPGLLMLASMLGRTGLVIAGFYLVSGGEWRGLLFCLAGFIVARILVTRLLPSVEIPNNSPLAEGSRHAS